MWGGESVSVSVSVCKSVTVSGPRAARRGTVLCWLQPPCHSPWTPLTTYTPALKFAVPVVTHAARLLLLVTAAAPAGDTHLHTAGSALAAAAAAAGQLRRGAPPGLNSGGPGSSPAAAAAAARAAAVLEAMSAQGAAALAASMPLASIGSWTGGSNDSASAAQRRPENSLTAAAAAASTTTTTPTPAAAGDQGAALGPSEPLPVLGLCWLDSDALALVCRQGYSSLLLVLGISSGPHPPAISNSSNSSSSNRHGTADRAPVLTLSVLEQVEWMDQPVSREWGTDSGRGGGGASSTAQQWGMDCGGTVMGCGPRAYLLGSEGGLFCGRIMAWSERLKTLQVCRRLLAVVCRSGAANQR